MLSAMHLCNTLLHSNDHPGDVQYLKMLQEERARSKGSRNRHPVHDP